MSLPLSSDQQELLALVQRVLRERVTPEYLRARIERPAQGSDLDLRGSLEELGLFELFGEGSEVGIRELCLIAREAGAVLLPEPLIFAVFAALFLCHRWSSAQERAAVSALLGAEKFAQLQSGAQYAAVALDASNMCITPLPASSEGESSQSRRTTFSGEVPLVRGGGEALCLLVPYDQTWWCIDLTRAVREAQSIVDGTMAVATLRLDSAAAVEVASQHAAQALSACFALVAAEMSGACSPPIALTRDYVMTREQFGRPIGAFQAVQHRLADMFTESESLRALVQFAAWALDHSPQQAELAARSALMMACRVTPRVIEGAVQLHGGIGFTWEHDLHLHLKRVRTLELLFAQPVEDSARLLDLAAAAR